MTYSIRMCREDEYERLRLFVLNSWKENHILSRNKALMDWQHLQEGQYNFVVAYHEETRSFHGALGIISPGFYANGKIEVGDDLWLAIWKVDKNLCADNSVGTAMLDYVEQTFKPKSIFAIGITKQVSFLYRLMGFKLGTLSHAFLKNPGLQRISIGNFAPAPGRSDALDAEGSVGLIEVFADDLVDYEKILVQHNPAKNLDFVVNRYSGHPIYNYRFFAVNNNDECVGFFVCRKITVEDASCIRIVEFFGLQNITDDLNHAFGQLLIDEESEYVDLVFTGFDETKLTALGFQLISADEYVPHLFEPFVQKPVSVQFAYKTKGTFHIFKGDSDLDRPS